MRMPDTTSSRYRGLSPLCLGRKLSARRTARNTRGNRTAGGSDAETLSATAAAKSSFMILPGPLKRFN
jgi:hypothetical protein